MGEHKHNNLEINRMTSGEIAKNGISGIRDNELAAQFEVWIKGERVITVTYEQVMNDEHALDKAQAAYFGTR